MISSPSSRLCVKWEPSIKILPFCEFHLRCIFSPGFTRLLLTPSSISSFEFSIICSRIRYCRFGELMSIGSPPAAAIAADAPVLVQTHIPDDHTFKLCETSYVFSENLVMAPLLFLDSVSDGWTSVMWPIRNLDTAAGLGLAISRSFNAGTNRVSENVDLTLQQMRVRNDRLSSASPYRTLGRLLSMSVAVHMHRAPWDLGGKNVEQHPDWNKRIYNEQNKLTARQRKPKKQKTHTQLTPTGTPNNDGNLILSHSELTFVHRLLSSSPFYLRWKCSDRCWFPTTELSHDLRNELHSVRYRLHQLRPSNRYRPNVDDPAPLCSHSWTLLDDVVTHPADHLRIVCEPGTVVLDVSILMPLELVHVVSTKYMTRKQQTGWLETTAHNCFPWTYRNRENPCAHMHFRSLLIFVNFSLQWVPYLWIFFKCSLFDDN